FITEPLPNWRSIWESAADRALVLSMEDPSTIRRAVADIIRAPYGGDSRAGQTGGGRFGFDFGIRCRTGISYHVCSMFAICSFRQSGTALFKSPQWPSLKNGVAGSGFCRAAGAACHFAFFRGLNRPTTQPYGGDPLRKFCIFRRMGRHILFKCPRLGTNVQHWLPATSPDEAGSNSAGSNSYLS